MAEGFIATRLEINDNLPAAVSYLNLTNRVENGKCQVVVEWGNPTSNWSGTAIVRKEGSAPTGFTDGVLVYEGSDSSFIDANVTEGTTYYYRAYTCNDRRQIQTTKVVKNIVPMTTVLFSSLADGSIVRNSIKEKVNTDITSHDEFIKISDRISVGKYIKSTLESNTVSGQFRTFSDSLDYAYNRIVCNEKERGHVSATRLASRNDAVYSEFGTAAKRKRLDPYGDPSGHYWLNDESNSSSAYFVDANGNIFTHSKTNEHYTLLAIEYTSTATVYTQPNKYGSYDFV